MKFEDMGIEDDVLTSLNTIGFVEPTKIQHETIPLIKEGHDVIGQSETGSGKTAAFGIPIVEMVKRDQGIQALILTSTRELAIQIATNLSDYSRAKSLKIQTVYGGVPLEPQMRGLKDADIVVGTPGRILDHMRRGNIDLSKVKLFVLDEADKMISMGFIDDIRTISSRLPSDRQTLLFSATMPKELSKIAIRLTRNPKKVKTKLKVEDKLLRQFYCDVEHKRKFSLLVHLIRVERPKLSIIFCNTRRDVDAVNRNLNENGIESIAIHGGFTQKRREKAINDFQLGRKNILVATDVAARGLDIKGITHIFNYGIPNDIEEYVNRIGRTARAGNSGKAITLLTTDDHSKFRKIISTYSFDVEKIKVDNFEMIPFRKFDERKKFIKSRSFNPRKHKIYRRYR